MTYDAIVHMLRKAAKHDGWRLPKKRAQKLAIVVVNIVAIENGERG